MPRGKHKAPQKADDMGSDESRLILRRIPLNDELWQPFVGHELSGLLALVKRMLAYWESTWFDSAIAIVPTDDQGLYDTLISDLHFLLDRSPLNKRERDQILSLVPDEFMNADLASIMDENIKGDILGSFTKSMSIVRRTCFRLGCLCNEDDTTGLFALFDGEIQEHLERNRVSVRDYKAQHPWFSTGNPAERLRQDVAEVEKRMRSLIDRQLSGDWTRVPESIRTKAEGRIENEIRANPGTDPFRFDSMKSHLDYVDLRELEQIMVSKRNWHKFVEIFSTKEMLQNRFGQLAPLRNAQAHHREFSDLIRSDAEAAIIWFRGALAKAEKPDMLGSEQSTVRD